MTNALGVPTHALPAWEALRSALLPERGIPCAGPARDDWHGSRKQQQRAADACLDCPILTPCQTYALTADEPDGVWGGTTQHERADRRTAGRKTA